MCNEIDFAEFTTWIQGKLDSYGMSNTALAEKLGVQQSTVSLWRTGKKRPSESNCVTLAHFFKEHPDRVLVMADYPPHSSAVNQEAEFLSTIRQLDEPTRKIILEMLKGMAERQDRR